MVTINFQILELLICLFISLNMPWRWKSQQGLILYLNGKVALYKACSTCTECSTFIGSTGILMTSFLFMHVTSIRSTSSKYIRLQLIYKLKHEAAIHTHQNLPHQDGSLARGSKYNKLHVQRIYLFLRLLWVWPPQSVDCFHEKHPLIDHTCTHQAVSLAI